MANPAEFDGYGPVPAEPKEGEEVKEGQVVGHWDKRLTSFQKLVFIKAFKDEKVWQIFLWM